MTLASQAVLRALVEDPTIDRYGLELSAATGVDRNRIFERGYRSDKYRQCRGVG